METDASGFALAGVLSQLDETTGCWHPVAFISRKMTPGTGMNRSRYTSYVHSTKSEPPRFWKWRRSQTVPWGDSRFEEFHAQNNSWEQKNRRLASKNEEDLKRFRGVSRDLRNLIIKTIRGNKKTAASTLFWLVMAGPSNVSIDRLAATFERRNELKRPKWLRPELNKVCYNLCSFARPMFLPISPSL